MGRCMFCRSIFFKLLETRFVPLVKNSEPGELTLLQKKRCKRCKEKNYFQKQLPGGRMTHISGEEWAASIALTQPVQDAGRFNIFASQYTKRISRGIEQSLETGGRRRA